ncbi:unnamed protein product [Microthlaspi erraticum]|uniref:Uncharacterized protein n=1 Tax=Microthlaspi erraticum TaxID=1685480 RepID=A0A6D2I9M9_9BRAS|nr:unnamed protein product [Microthlaspi erraticum]
MLSKPRVRTNSTNNLSKKTGVGGGRASEGNVYGERSEDARRRRRVTANRGFWDKARELVLAEGGAKETTMENGARMSGGDRASDGGERRRDLGFDRISPA